MAQYNKRIELEKKIPEGIVTPAHLQGYLLQNRHLEPLTIVENIAGWRLVQAREIRGRNPVEAGLWMPKHAQKASQINGDGAYALQRADARLRGRAGYSEMPMPQL